MLEWLKTILGEAYTDDIDKAVSGEIGKSFVAKTNYDQRNTAYKDLQKQLQDRDTQLEELKKVDASSLQAEIEKLQQTNKTQMEDYEKKIAEMQLSFAIESALNNAGAKNIKAVKALLDNSKLSLKEDGTVEGLNDQLDVLSKASDSSFLFNTSTQTQIDGFHPAQSSNGGTASKDPKDMSYTELAAYMTAHPDFTLN